MIVFFLFRYFFVHLYDQPIRHSRHPLWVDLQPQSPMWLDRVVIKLSGDLQALSGEILGWNEVLATPLWHNTGLIPGFGPSNERWRYLVTRFLNGWAQALNQPCYGKMSFKCLYTRPSSSWYLSIFFLQTSHNVHSIAHSYHMGKLQGVLPEFNSLWLSDGIW